MRTSARLLLLLMLACSLLIGLAALQTWSEPETVLYVVEVNSARIEVPVNRRLSDAICDALGFRRPESKVKIVVGSSSPPPTWQP